MKNLLLLAAILLVPGFASAETLDSNAMSASYREQIQEQIDATKTITNAISAYRTVALNSPQGPVPVGVRDHAKCIAVFPNAITAAAVVGGTRGQGILSCRNDLSWSTPAIVNLTAASIGVQLGGKVTDIVLFIRGDTLVSALKRGTLAVGADASMVVGKYDSNADSTPNGIVAYQLTEGAYAGASIGTGKISIDDAATKALYGKDTIALKLIDGVNTGRSTESETFTKLLPSA